MPRAAPLCCVTKKLTTVSDQCLRAYFVARRSNCSLSGVWDGSLWPRRLVVAKERCKTL